MFYTTKQMLEILQASREAFENSLDNESVVENVTEFGFPRERLTKDFELNQKADEYFRDQGSKRGFKGSVYTQVEVLLGKSIKTFRKFRRILKKAFKKQPEIIKELQLNVPLPGTNLGLTKRLKEFYQICRKKETLQAKVIVYGLSKERLETEENSIITIEKGFLDKSLARMESEKATYDRNTIIQALLDEWNIYKEVLIACYGDSDPQFLEGFGIKVPSGGLFQRRRKKKKEDTDTGEDNTTDNGNETDEANDAAADDEENKVLETVKITKTKSKAGKSGAK